ncbi:MAG: cell division protein FtsZ [Cyclobacteriaceae bacterium]
MTFNFPSAFNGSDQSYQPGSTYKFDIPHNGRSIIKVVGVGGGGSNAVNHMFRMGIKDVEFIICNTDSQALKSSPIPHKLQIGTTLTEGLGCGANPEVGRAAAVESHEQIREALQGAKMVFITAGMGGGTGTGAAPVIAKIAREMDILTVGIVTMPFAWEGKKKIAQANHGVNALKENCDTVLVILNNRLRDMFGNLAISQAFAEADNVLTTAAKGIAEIITLTGYVNVDFQDVRTVMRNAGAAVMGSAETKGEDRAVNAARLALASPLLDNTEIMGAKKILLSIISGDEAELQMDELSTITNYIQEQAGDRCEVIFGHGVDSSLGDRIRVTVIATGFYDSKRRVRKAERKVMDLETPPAEEGLLPESDNSVNNVEQEMYLKTVEEPVSTHTPEEIQFWSEPEPEPENHPTPIASKPTETENFFDEEKEEEEKPVFDFRYPEIKDETPSFTTLSLFPEEKTEEEKPHAEWNFDQEEEEEGLFAEDEESGLGSEEADDQVSHEQLTMGANLTRKRLEEQARKRREQLEGSKRNEMTKEEFNSKWSTPAYLRRGVQMENVPHSSQSHISRFNLNDDNTILGNNKFLHDNVD